jgi:hypothetical protein
MIRFAKDSDIPAIMSFIDKYWRKNHIMSRHRELFEFQHKWGDEVSFILSEKEDTITGVLGYIPYSKKNRDVTLAIWKTNKTEDTMQGIKVLSFLRENGDVHKLSAPGINPKTIPIYKFLGLGTGKMKQWYRLRGAAEFKIAKVVDDVIPECDATDSVMYEELDNFAKAQFEFRLQECLSRDRQLTKSLDFIERRYFNHPSFTYLKYGLESNDKKLFVVLRVQEYNDSALLRVIDCIGDHELFQHFTPELDRLLEEYGCEYADCYESGVRDEIFLKGGWKMVVGSGNIMPDYFAPFEQRNIDIYYMSEIEDVILFKGDGDMDRPN